MLNIPIDLHLSIEAVVEHEIMSHTYAMWLHGMSLSIVVVANVAIVVVAHFSTRLLA